MKKLLMVLAFAGVSVASMAQDAVPTEKYSVATNSFWSNWFVQANVVGTAFWGNQEVQNNFDKSPLKGFRNNLGFSVAIGKWFTPGLGLRTKFNGIWGRTVVSTDKETNANKYWTLNEQVLFNLSNILLGYNENRVWDFIPYAGVGLNRNMSADLYAPVWGVGILNEFKLNKKLAINLDINYNIGLNDYDGFTGILPGAKQRDGRTFQGFIANHDRTLNVEIGLTYNLGKAGWSKTPDVEAIKALSQGQIDALNAQLADANAENARLQKQIRDHKCPTTTNALDTKNTVKEIVSAPVSVFFNLGKAKIASQKDLQNVQAVADAAKANNAKILVTGYADSKTGSANLNQSLSQKRAEAVADALVNMGVDRSNIEINAAGGVDTLSPISYNRRATVELK
ncbi:MAG: OmpA family protein [Prevotella sp.]|nr:OmpA family protein [Prevotella sp.]